MMKIIIAICAILLLTSCTNNNVGNSNSQSITPAQTEQPQKLEVNIDELLNQIKKDTKLGFSDPGPLQFSWKLAGEKLGKVRNLEKATVSGQAIALMNTPQIEKESNMPIVTVLSNYLIDLGLSKNVYNAQAGTVSGIEAFDKQNLVCLVNWEIIGGVDGYQTPGVPMNIAVVCGEVGE